MVRHIRWSRLLFEPVVALVMVFFAVAAVAQGEEEILGSGEPPAFQAVKGRITFRTYCASCHGEKGDGRGNLAGYLNVKPTDLTRLAIEHGGTYPRDLVQVSIDGRRSVPGHGTREMPVWGEVFQSPLAGESSGMSGEERAECKICELVYFLETLQAEAEGGD